MLRSGCKALHPVAQLRSMTGSCRRQQSPATSEWARRRATHPAARPYIQTYTPAARPSTGARYPRAASSAPNSLRLPRRPIIAAPALPSQGWKAQKTVKACQGQWRALSIANQRTTTEKEYVVECRAGGVGARPGLARAAVDAAPSQAIRAGVASPVVALV
jgi:hypothetical protein